MEIFQPHFLNINNKRVIAVQFLNRFLQLCQCTTHSPQDSWNFLREDYTYLAEGFSPPHKRYEAVITKLEAEIKVLQSRLQQQTQALSTPSTPKPSLFTHHNTGPPSAYKFSASLPNARGYPDNATTPSNTAIEEHRDRLEFNATTPDADPRGVSHPPFVVSPHGVRHRWGQPATQEEIKTVAFLTGLEQDFLEDEVMDHNEELVNVPFVGYSSLYNTLSINSALYSKAPTSIKLDVPVTPPSSPPPKYSDIASKPPLPKPQFTSPPKTQAPPQPAPPFTFTGKTTPRLWKVKKDVPQPQNDPKPAKGKGK